MTVHDVASLAGVSTASVSRVLSGRRNVGADVDERVRSAATELGYQVNAVGRSLRRQSTETVGLVIADITNLFFPSLTKALEDAFAHEGSDYFSLTLPMTWPGNEMRWPGSLPVRSTPCSLPR